MSSLTTTRERQPMIKSLLPIFAVLLLHFQCSSKSLPREIIQDRDFKQGIKVLGHSSASPSPIDTLHPFKHSVESVAWVLPQWGSKHVMQEVMPIRLNDSIIYSNNAKKVVIFPQKGKTTQITLAVNGSEEYIRPREFNEEWPHLLLEQYFSSPVQLHRIDELIYKTRGKINYCHNRMGNQFNPEIHTAQITQFFTIQNGNIESLDYGNFFWFGLPLFDYRYNAIALYAAQDLGKEDASKKFIYSVASHDIFEGSMHSQQWITINTNILPFIQQAFATAQQRGYLLQTKYDDLTITTMNIGWEVPGTFDCAITFDSPSLTTTN